MKTDAERGAVGVWLRRERLARGWSTDDVVEHLEEPVAPATILALESGRSKPSPVLLAAIVRLYGSEPDEGALPLSPDAKAIVAAINELRDAILGGADVEVLGQGKPPAETD